jgi:hypothetical protein
MLIVKEADDFDELAELPTPGNVSYGRAMPQS